MTAAQRIFEWRPGVSPKEATVHVGGHHLPVMFHRRKGARHYRIFLKSDHAVFVTVPWHGSRREAMAFVEQARPWLQARWDELQAKGMPPLTWRPGAMVLLNGEWEELHVEIRQGNYWLRFGAHRCRTRDVTVNLRPIVEDYLHKKAKSILVKRTGELADRMDVQPRRVMIRNQSSRWGSCSGSGTVSLNWRLLQATELARDYVIIHELSHLKELNHSKRFWAIVRDACPAYMQAEKWLERHAAAVGLG